MRHAVRFALPLLVMLLASLAWGPSSAWAAGETQPSAVSVRPQIPGGQDGFGLEWVTIPAGTYLMGCSEGDTSCETDEKPQHLVYIGGFQLMRYEVTQGLYRQLTESNPSKNETCGDACPVDNVTWEQAKTFCTRVGGRLPTEAEWEYAARAGNPAAYYGPVEQVGWYADNSSGKPRPVGGKQPNAWGLHDMLGNAWEWVADTYAAYKGGQERDPVNEQAGERRVFRGGSAEGMSTWLRVSDRAWAAEGWEVSVGFRCAR